MEKIFSPAKKKSPFSIERAYSQLTALWKMSSDLLALGISQVAHQQVYVSSR